MEKYYAFFQEKLALRDRAVIRQILAAAREEKLEKGKRMVEAGERQTHLSFLVSGILRGQITDENGADITDCFLIRPGEAVIGSDGLSAPSRINIEALTDVELLRVPVDALMELMEQYPMVLRVYSRLLQESLSRHWEMKRVLYQPAMRRYLWFLECYPGLIDCVSNRHIASFLGMTPVTLSRLRRQLREEAQGKT